MPYKRRRANYPAATSATGCGHYHLDAELDAELLAHADSDPTAVWEIEQFESVEAPVESAEAPETMDTLSRTSAGA